MTTRHVGRHRPQEALQGPRWHRRVSGSILALFALSSAVPAVPVQRLGSSTDTDVIPVIPTAPATPPAIYPVAPTVTPSEAELLRIDAAKVRAAKLVAFKAAKLRAKERAAKVRALAFAHRYTAPLWGPYVLTSGFGFRWGRMHPAQDLATPVGTPVHAITSGRIIFAGWSSDGYGYMVLLRHWDGAVSRYAHNSRLRVSVGDYVSAAQVISYSGNTGNSTGPHLHIEVWPNGRDPVPPVQWLARKGVRI